MAELVHSWAALSAVLGLPDWKTVIAFWPHFALTFVGAYLLGSVPFGLLLTAVSGRGDIRKIGSGNIGATNVLRTGAKWLAAATLALDIAKGFAAVTAARAVMGPDGVIVAGLAVVIGHLYPIWLAFRGGKGVATTLGVHLAVAWPIGLAAIVLWLVTAVLFRFSSLAALIAVAGAPIAAWLFSGAQATTLAVILAVLVWIKHGGNIRRLLRGQELRIKLK
ncbi:MAG: glycerol-3-phosphate 1-O-acyltransferase PlsY [Alphaproteobacteria bacterium]|nr:glycerol-3-phosphate 1-O-acyltransferase PlsY [Alphaproteobacteria bacterium]MCZ6764687.1 glycerol-3-phosphate 1-O-acyltransferase PlsY [Alphaproteobacteria bacterium]